MLLFFIGFWDILLIFGIFCWFLVIFCWFLLVLLVFFICIWLICWFGMGMRVFFVYLFSFSGSCHFSLWLFGSFGLQWLCVFQRFCLVVLMFLVVFWVSIFVGLPPGFFIFLLVIPLSAPFQRSE